MKIDLKRLASEMVREDEAFVERLRGMNLSASAIRRTLTSVETAAMKAAAKLKAGPKAIDRLAQTVKRLKKKALGQFERL